MGGNESKALDVGGTDAGSGLWARVAETAAAADQREQAKEIRERNAAAQELNRKQRP